MTNEFGNPDVAGSSPGIVGDHELVFQATTVEETEVVLATLKASGIEARLLHNSNLQIMGAVDNLIDTEWRNGVYVPAADAASARAILSAEMPTVEELTAEEEADPLTLEEAEAQTKNA